MIMELFLIILLILQQADSFGGQIKKDARKCELDTRKQWNLSDLTFRVALFKKDSETPKIQSYLEQGSNVSIGSRNSFENMTRDFWICWKTFFDLRLIFNFRYEFVRVPDGEDAIVNGNADLGLFMKTFTVTRSNNFTFPQPLREVTFQFFVKKPRVASLRNLHLNVFLKETWYTFLATSGTFYIFGCCLYSWEAEISFTQICWVIGLLTGKSTEPLVSNSTKITSLVLILGLVYGMIIQTFYADSIISALSKDLSSLSRVDDLIPHGYQFTTHRKSQALQDRIKAELNDRNGYTSVDNKHQITHVLQSKVAHLAYNDKFFEEARKQKFSDDFICQTLASVKVLRGVQFPRTIVLKKNSKYVGYFNYGIIRIKEVGLNSRYNNEFTKYEKLCTSHQGKVLFESFGWEHIHFPLSIISGGIIVSTIFMVAENRLHHRKVKRSQ